MRGWFVLITGFAAKRSARVRSSSLHNVEGSKFVESEPISYCAVALNARTTLVLLTSGQYFFAVRLHSLMRILLRSIAANQNHAGLIGSWTRIF